MRMITTDTPVRLEVRYFGGRGHTERFRTLAEATAWLTSPAFTALAPRVRTVTIVQPHARYAADPDRGQPGTLPVDPWLGRGISGDYAA